MLGTGDPHVATNTERVTRRTFLGAAALLAAAGPAAALAQGTHEPLKAAFSRAGALRWGMPRHAHLVGCASDEAGALEAVRAMAVRYDTALPGVAQLERVTVQRGGGQVLATLHYADAHRAVISAGRCAGAPGGVVRLEGGEIVLSAEDLLGDAPAVAGRGAALILRRLA